MCPREPGDEVTALATEHAARIAAEGRKFGLYLLVSTQRPHRVNDLVVSQCDNLVLMRMTSVGDLGYVADTLSFAPPALLQEATSFRMGESLVAGKIASHPAFVRFGPRRLRGGRLRRARHLGGTARGLTAAGTVGRSLGQSPVACVRTRMSCPNRCAMRHGSSWREGAHDVP